jgi:hypothetical protein
MKKILLCLLTLAGIFTEATAQIDRGYIGFSFGSSIPVGNFASTDMNNEYAGLAKPGVLFDINFAYRLGNGSFGIMGMLRGQANPFDAQAFADDLALMSPGTAFTVEAKPWSVGGLMVGGFGAFRVSDRTKFEAKALIGFINANSPEIKISSGAQWVKESSASSTTFGYLIGAGFRTEIGRRVYLLTGIDYMGEKPEFNDVKITSNSGDSSTIDTFSQPMGAISINLGLALKL